MKKIKKQKYKKKKIATKKQAEKECRDIAAKTLKPYKAKRGPYKTK